VPIVLQAHADRGAEPLWEPTLVPSQVLSCF
jgi:hypothetical protein